MNKSLCCKGVTLIELMIAMLLGTLIMAACLEVFLVTKKLLARQQALVIIQENALSLATLLGKSIRTSGNIGCNNFQNISLRIHASISAEEYGLNRLEALIGISHQRLKDNSLITQKNKEKIVIKSDLLWVKSIPKNYALVQSTQGEEGFLIVEGKVKLSPGKTVAISDCHRADFVKIDKTEIQKNHFSKLWLNTGALLLSKRFDKTAQVGILSSKIFYMANTQRKNISGMPIYALYSTDLNGRTYEQVEGIEQFKVRYGIKQQDQIIYYPQEDVPDWSALCSVKIVVLLTSINEVLNQPQAYFYDNQTIMPSDRLLRRQYIYQWPIKRIKCY